MANTDKVYALPDQEIFSNNDITLQTGSAAWTYSSWKKVDEYTTTDANIIGLTFQITATPTADTVQEYIVEIGIGAVGNEVTKIQIPYSQKTDTNVGIYLAVCQIMLPEAYYVPAGSTISVRVTGTTANTIINGLKINYSSTQKIWGKEAYPNNQHRVQVANGMSTSMGGVM